MTIINEEWREQLYAHYKDNVHIRRWSTSGKDVKIIAKEEELTSRLLLDCYDLLNCDHETQDQDFLIEEVFKAAHNLVTWKRRNRR